MFWVGEMRGKSEEARKPERRRKTWREANGDNRWGETDGGWSEDDVEGLSIYI